MFPPPQQHLFRGLGLLLHIRSNRLQEKTLQLNSSQTPYIYSIIVGESQDPSDGLGSKQKHIGQGGAGGRPSLSGSADKSSSPLLTARELFCATSFSCCAILLSIRVRTLMSCASDFGVFVSLGLRSKSDRQPLLKVQQSRIAGHPRWKRSYDYGHA